MKKNYVLTLTTNEENPYNKYNYIIMDNIKDKLSWLDIVSEKKFPKVEVKGTKEEIDILIELLKNGGFAVEVKEN